jgi:starch synthase (maltosyl-transferring)
MEFDWVYVNPLNYCGFSGSLYSIKDYFRLNPRFAPPDAQDQHSWEPVRAFIERCHQYGIKFMIDLVINHTAIDSPLVEEHPDWYKVRTAVIERLTHQVVRYYELDEQIPEWEYPPDQYEIRQKISNPYAIDPADARKVTIWGDLAEIDNAGSPKKDEIYQYWKKLMDFYLDLGVDGFRCDAAYQVPSSLWRLLIEYVKKRNPAALFLAENLGCTLKQCEMLTKAGFDYIHSSSKWWDFTAPWAIEQYNEFRVFAPSVSFPESHDTKRLALESNGREDYQKFRYFFAAFFSAGVLMPIGYEYLFRVRLDVVDMEPAQWEWPTHNISDFIKFVNRFKRDYPVLNMDGPMVHFPYPNLGILLLRKSTEEQDRHMLLLYNKDWNNSQEVYLEKLADYLPLSTPVYQLELTREKIPISEKSFRKVLIPNEYIVLYQEAN